MPKTGQANTSKAKTSQVMKSKNPYKLTGECMFGNLWIDQEKLNDFKLEAHKDDKKVPARKADRDLIELLTERTLQYTAHNPSRPSRS